MTICKELPGAASSSRDRTLLVTSCLSVLLHFLLLIPFVELLTENNALPPVRDIPIEISIAPQMHTPVASKHKAAAAPVAQEASSMPDTTPEEETAPETLQEAPPKPAPVQIQEPAPTPKPQPKPLPKALPRPRHITTTPYHHSASPAMPASQESSYEAPSPASYEQLVALWYRKHQMYSDTVMGDEDALLRIRLNRQGNLTLYTLDKSTGDDRLDQLIINSVKNASPFPPIPSYYSSNAEEEFLIPINVATPEE